MEEIDNVLVDFLEEQVEQISKKLSGAYPLLTSEVTWRILSPFSTIEGTKDPISRKELNNRLPEIDQIIINDVVKQFLVCRLLREDKTSGETCLEQVLEIAHDSLAKPIADKRSVDEKAILEVKRLIASQVGVNPDARELFTEKQLVYIDSRLDKIQLNAEEELLIQKSRERVDELLEAERRIAKAQLKEQKIRIERQELQFAKIRKYFVIAMVVACIAFGITKMQSCHLYSTP